MESIKELSKIEEENIDNIDNKESLSQNNTNQSNALFPQDGNGEINNKNDDSKFLNLQNNRITALNLIFN